MWWDAVSGPADSLSASWYPDASFLLLVITICALGHCLNILSRPAAPRVTVNRKLNKNRMTQLVDGMESLQKPYVAPKLWGRSGHVQTAIYGALKHRSLNRRYDHRILLPLDDGSTASFDLFEPIRPHESGLDVTLVLTPGISNCAESNYIRTCIHYALGFGRVKWPVFPNPTGFRFRCAALNHIGVIPSVEVTGHRIFNYGITDELTAMMDYLYEHYQQTLFINVGFSMGGNLTALYVIRTPKECRPRNILAMSVCQGYSATVSVPMYHEWMSGRRFYNQMIVENVKRLLRRNYEAVVAPHVRSGKIGEAKLWSLSSIIAMDEHYNRRVTDLPDLDSFYEWCSCLPRLDKIDLPMIFLNAEDDPVIPAQVYHPIQNMCEELEDMAFVSTKHGGHLGFLEGGSFSPSSVTWLDRFIVESANQALIVYATKAHGC